MEQLCAYKHHVKYEDDAYPYHFFHSEGFLKDKNISQECIYKPNIRDEGDEAWSFVLEGHDAEIKTAHVK